MSNKEKAMAHLRVIYAYMSFALKRGTCYLGLQAICDIEERADAALSLLKEQEAVEPKTGHWIESKCLDECFWVCSECNFQSEAIAAPKLYKYCPNCGTKMEEQAVKLDD